MQSFWSIGWFIAAVISIYSMFVLIGFSGLTSMFPEGKRWYHIPLQFLSIAFYTYIVLHHPFK